MKSSTRCSDALVFTITCFTASLLLASTSSAIVSLSPSYSPLRLTRKSVLMTSHYSLSILSQTSSNISQSIRSHPNPLSSVLLQSFISPAPTLTSIFRSRPLYLSVGEGVWLRVLPYELANRRRRGVPRRAGQGYQQSETIVVLCIASI
jgi:hypothetical protein